MQFAAVYDDDITELMTWFSNDDQVRRWGGPSFRYPFTKEQFIIDLKLNELYSFGIFDNQRLIAFGQYYNRLDRCHLGRLVVSPRWRKRGVGTALIEKLCTSGQQALGLSSYSLFVLRNNHSAVRLYQRCGFKEADYPETISIPDCLYMIRE